MSGAGKLRERSSRAQPSEPGATPSQSGTASPTGTSAPLFTGIFARTYRLPYDRTQSRTSRETGRSSDSDPAAARGSPFHPLVPCEPHERRVNDERREELLGILENLVLEQGFSTATMDDFAAHAKCSKTTLYALSSTKEGLVATLFRRFFREATNTIEHRIAGVAPERARIADYLSAVGDAMSRMSPACYEDMMQLRVTRDIYEVNSDAAANRVRGFIEDGIAAGEFRATDARFIGEVVSLLIDGIMHGILLERTGLTSGQAYNEVGALVLNALRHSPE